MKIKATRAKTNIFLTLVLLPAAFFFLALARPAVTHGAAAEQISLTQYFEQKADGFILPEIVFFSYASKPAFACVEAGAVRAFELGKDEALWHYKTRAGVKIKTVSASFDRSKLLLVYEDNSFDIVVSETGKLAHSETAPAASLLSAPSPRGFIVVRNEAAHEYTDGGGGQKLEICASNAVALDSMITDSGRFYFATLGPAGFEIYGGPDAAGSQKVCRAELTVKPSTRAMLYFNASGGGETLKYSLAESDYIKIFDCSKQSAEAVREIKTGSPVLALYGGNGLPGGASLIVARGENSLAGFSDADSAMIFELASKAKPSFQPAVIQPPGAGPYILYFKSGDTVALYDAISAAQAAEFKLEGRPQPGRLRGIFSKTASSAFFIIPYLNSICCLQLQGMRTDGDFYFSSDLPFAQTRISPAAKLSLPSTEALKNFDLKKIKEFYEANEKIVQIAAGAFFGLVIIIWLIRGARRRFARERGANGGGAKISEQIERIKEMLVTSPESVELLLNLIQLLKKDNKLEEAAEYYKSLIKLRPNEEQYYEELLDLKQGYFPFINELVALYRKKARIKEVISAYEARRAAAAPEDSNYAAVLRILSRLYLEDRPYQGETQSAAARENSKKAMSLLEEIIRLEPNSIDELTALASLYQKSEEYEKAAEIYKKLTEIDRSNNLINHYCSLFSIYNRLAQPEDAAEIFRVAIELKTSAAETLLPLAHEFFTESLNNGNKKAVLTYGDCIVSAYGRQKNVNAALSALDKILAAYPQEKSLLKRKAFMMLENEVDADLLGTFKQLCDLFADDARIRFEYARLLFKNGKPDESVAIILDGLKKKENEEKYLELFTELAASMIKEKKFQRVIDLAPLVYKLSQAPACLKCLAEAYLKSGDLDRANDIYLKVMELTPSDAGAVKRQKYVKTLIDERGLIEMKTPGAQGIELSIDGEPVTVKRTAVDMESRVQVSPFEIQTAEAKLHFEKGDYKKAIPIFQRLAKTAPDNKKALVINMYLINCFLKEGMAAAAEKVYDSVDAAVMKLSQGEQLAFKFKAGCLFLENGRLEKAEAVFSEVAAIDMGYKNVGEMIASVKKKLAENRAEPQKTFEAADDSERTMIATVATEVDYIDKRYQVVGQLGKGGMGIVYKATDTQTGSTVAIKIPILSFKGDRGFMERFEREADLSSRLKHPNILNVFSVVKGELPYMVMELLNGRSLKEILKEKKSFTPQQMRDIAVQCCDALSYTHGMNIIHRDVKPENVMIVENNTVKIMDFGLAKALDESSMTRAGTIMGTFAYISPEQCVGEQIDGRADIYSLGIMMYEMLTGEKPFTSGDFVHQHLKVKPVAPTKKNPLIPYPVEAIVLKCIEKKPQDRYQTAAELKDALLKIA